MRPGTRFRPDTQSMCLLLGQGNLRLYDDLLVFLLELHKDGAVGGRLTVTAHAQLFLVCRAPQWNGAPGGSVSVSK